MTTMYLLLFTCTVQYKDIYDRSVWKSGVLQRLVCTHGTLPSRLGNIPGCLIAPQLFAPHAHCRHFDATLAIVFGWLAVAVQTILFIDYVKD
jgi:hypothetical protein